MDNNTVFSAADKKRFFILLGGKESWSSEEVQNFWNYWDEDNLKMAQGFGWI